MLAVMDTETPSEPGSDTCRRRSTSVPPLALYLAPVATSMKLTSTLAGGKFSMAAVMFCAAMTKDGVASCAGVTGRLLLPNGAMVTAHEMKTGALGAGVLVVFTLGVEEMVDVMLVVGVLVGVALGVGVPVGVMLGVGVPVGVTLGVGVLVTEGVADEVADTTHVLILASGAPCPVAGSGTWSLRCHALVELLHVQEVELGGEVASAGHGVQARLALCALKVLAGHGEQVRSLIDVPALAM